MTVQPQKALLGFRKWSIDPYNVLLPLIMTKSSTGRTVWESGINFASCCSDSNVNPHNAPGPGNRCHCGFNAFYCMDIAMRSYSGILGAIAGSGDMQLHKHGFRSSEAQIIGLWAPIKFYRQARKISKSYSVPLYTDLRKFYDASHQLAMPIDAYVRQYDSELDYQPERPRPEKSHRFDKKLSPSDGILNALGLV